MNDTRNQYGTVSRPVGIEIDEGLRSYMLGVYNYMALAVAGTGIVSYFLAQNEGLVFQIAGSPLKWVVFAAIIGIGWFSPKIIFSGSRAMAHGMFWLYAGLWGILIAPMLYSFVSSGAASEVYKAFFITATVFGSMSLYGYTTKKNLSGWGSFLVMASIGLLIAIVANVIFFQSTLMSLVTSSLVVLVFSAVTAWETQTVKSMYQEGSQTNERASIFGAFMLYGSFVTLFIHILNILGIMDE